MRFRVMIMAGEIEAATAAEANEKAIDLLYSLAESNDGSEVLANARPHIELLGD